jgi:hypothetical protein
MKTEGSAATTCRATVTPAVPEVPSAWSAREGFADRAPPVAVVVKRRRAVDQAQTVAGVAGMPPTRGASGSEAERKPRVFVVCTEQRPLARAAVGVAGPPDSAPARNLRRRTSPLQRPGKVLHIVPPQTAAMPEDVSAEQAAFWLALPCPGEYQAVLDSLAGVKAILDEAAAANKFRLNGRPGKLRRAA